MLDYLLYCQFLARKITKLNKMKHSIYKLLVKSLQILPFKKKIFELIKKNDFLNNKLYKDLKFEGDFMVEIDKDKKFVLHHFGGRIENETYWKGLFNTFEYEMGWIWIMLSKKSHVILDIGANTGIYSLVAKTVNPSSEIYAFEPSRNTFSKLIQNISTNQFNIRSFDIALSNTTGTSTFYDSFDPNQTSASMSDKMHQLWENFNVNSYEVKTIKGIDFVTQNNIKSIDILKIDVEMFEPQVIEGFGDVLFKHRPYIFIEVLSNDIAEKLNLLFKDEFAYYHLSDKNIMCRKNQLEMVPLKWNYILCPKDKLFEFENEFQNFIKNA